MKMLHLAPAMLALLAAMPATAAESETPIITFKTTLYETAGASNAFHFYIGATEKTYIDVDFGFGPVEVEVGQATFDSTAGAISATTVTGTVGTEGIVKIYGDASLIDYLDLEGVYATELDMPTLTNLEILNLDHNLLKRMDLTPFSKLQALYINDNPFDETPLLIGPNKPDLTILEMGSVGALNQSFDIADYPALQSFDAFATHDLRKVTPSGCPNLLRLSIDNTSVSELDVTKNEKLLILNISCTPITNIDITKNTALQQFFCTSTGSWMNNYKIKSLDLSRNKELVYLMCQGNDMTELDVSNNPNLMTLYCNENLLPGIDISKNLYINSLNISNNLMDFTTMPLPREDFSEYYYYQRRMPLDRSYAVGTEIDMSSRVIRPDSETWFALFERQRDEDGNNVDIELPEDYYEFKDGKVTLLKETTDSVYLAFANSLFPTYDLQSSLFKVKSVADFGKDNAAVTLRTRPGVSKIAFSIGIQGATPESPKKFSVDFGDGNPVEFSTTTNVLPAEPNASGDVKRTGSMTIYLPEGTDLSALGIDGVGLTSINVTPSACITDLSLTNCQISNIDLQWNRCLTNLDLSGNNLTILDLNGADGANGKNLLSSIKAANNKLTSIEPGLLNSVTVDLSNNNFSEINLLKASNLRELNLSGNQITEVAIQDLEAIKHLDLSSNLLSEILIADYIDLDYLNLSNNVFPLSTLPQAPKAQTYVYAPQQPWALPEQAPTANLSKQLLNDATTFTWHKADGTLITDAEAIKENNPGIFQLCDTKLGAIYCTFTNPAFPAFTGENAYRTTDITVAEMPQNVVCSFKTLADGIGSLAITGKKRNTMVYIDWEGNGALEQFVATTVDPTYYDVDVHANAEVKVYAYEKECGLTVFSLGAGPLEYIDASQLTELIHFSVAGSHIDIDKISLPEANLEELVITNGELTSASFLSKYPEIWLLNLSANNLSDLDLSVLPKLKAAYAGSNKLTNVILENPVLYDLALNNNLLENIDLSGALNISQLWLFTNNFKTLDISPLKNLGILDISENYFNFLTVPSPDYEIRSYTYSDQYPIEGEVVDGKIDLSGYGAETFRWFIDSPYIDEETGDLYGEELVEGEEYTIENGVTTFLKNFTHIMCVLQNAAFPDLKLYTNFMDAHLDSAINEVEISGSQSGDIYDLQGRRVTNPGHGLYIRDGRVIKL
ncbi:MAG: leucine-rich repeat domain-containing protein [Bacteroides sp.]|nr:leucine-rich repeat domain-containing protein [Bacteroides sp.]